MIYTVFCMISFELQNILTYKTHPHHKKHKIKIASCSNQMIPIIRLSITYITNKRMHALNIIIPKLCSDQRYIQIKNKTSPA